MAARMKGLHPAFGRRSMTYDDALQAVQSAGLGLDIGSHLGCRDSYLVRRDQALTIAVRPNLLERRQLDLAVGTLRLDAGDTKNDDGSVVYLTPELDVVLGEQVERVGQLQRETKQITPWLFPHLHGRQRLGKRRQDIEGAWKAACEAAGVPGRIPHDFRRTAVRSLERAGVPRAMAMKITGHRTEAIHRRYAIVSDAELREATTRLARLAIRGAPRAVEAERRGRS